MHFSGVLEIEGTRITGHLWIGHFLRQFTIKAYWVSSMNVHIWVLDQSCCMGNK
jgi:hypothetical protein